MRVRLLEWIRRRPLWLLGVGLVLLLPVSVVGGEPSTSGTGRRGIRAALPAASPEEVYRRHLQAGREFLRRGLREEALESLELALELSPGAAEARRELGKVCRALGDARAAEEHFRRVLSAHPGDLEAQEGLAAAYADRCGEERAMADSALAWCARILEVDPGRVEAYLQAARVHEILGDLPTSIMMESQGRLVAAGDALVPSPQSGRRLLNARVYSEAYWMFRTQLARDAGDTESLRIIAHLDYRMGRAEAAVEAYQEILRREPQATTALQERKNLADCLAQLGRYEAAALCWEEVAEAEPEVLRHHSALAGAWLEAGRPERAVSALDRALSLPGRRGCLWFQRGAALEALAKTARGGGMLDLARRRRSEAIEAYGRALGEVDCAEQARRRREELAAGGESIGAARANAGVPR